MSVLTTKRQVVGILSEVGDLLGAILERELSEKDIRIDKLEYALEIIASTDEINPLFAKNLATEALKHE